MGISVDSFIKIQVFFIRTIIHRETLLVVTRIFVGIRIIVIGIQVAAFCVIDLIVDDHGLNRTMLIET